MGLRVRKSFKVGGVRVNLSKSGIGYSIGTKGYRITKTANGRTRKTASIPGTGISYVSESGSKKRKTATATTYNKEYSPNAYKASSIILPICGYLFIALGLVLLAIEAPMKWACIVAGIIFILVGKSHKKTYKSMESGSNEDEEQV